MSAPELLTDRLLLRSWRDTDADRWAELNADPEVMEHFPATLDRDEADASRLRFSSSLERQGWGLWAVEVRGTGLFIGFIGLAAAPFDADFTPAVEVGWRLHRDAWGNGYATEGARMVLAHAFGEMGLDEVVSFTATTNQPSEAVMRRIGMQPHPHGPFDHPNLPRGHHLQRHLLYRITATGWRNASR